MADKNRRISFLLFYYIILFLLFFLTFFLIKKNATTRVQIADDTLSLPFILQYKKH